MDNNTGSFGAAIGGGDPIKEAMSRRGMVPTTSQSSVGQAPVPMTPQGQPGLPTQGGQESSMNSMGAMTTPDDTNLIIKALSEKLKSESKIKEHKNINLTTPPNTQNIA